MLGNSRRTRPHGGTGIPKATKSNSLVNKDQNVGKRQGDTLQDPTQKRRAAMGDITNALNDKTNLKVALKKSKFTALKPAEVTKPSKENKPKKVLKRSSVKSLPKSASSETLEESVISLSQGSAISSSSEENLSSQSSLDDLLIPVEETTPKGLIPEDVDNVDKENMSDPVQVALYAFDIFNYYKERELQFQVHPYMTGQKALTSSMRAILVDWLVEVQENFELNHETLYLAVKLVDLYLSHKHIAKEVLQLLGASALFIASKFDERCPPLVEDFLYICDDAYKRHEFLEMERNILKTIGFDIGFPLSYRFLRRYAKCGRASMETLTLARYILEMSLMEYDFIHIRESQMAASSLLLAFHMKKAGHWTKTLEFYTGYTEGELGPILRQLNTYITAPPKQLTTIRSKYSHKVFYEVAKIPALPEEEGL